MGTGNYDPRADLDQAIHLLAEMMADKPPPPKSTKISKSMKSYWDSPAGQARRRKKLCSRHRSSQCSCAK